MSCRTINFQCGANESFPTKPYGFIAEIQRGSFHRFTVLTSNLIHIFVSFFTLSCILGFQISEDVENRSLATSGYGFTQIASNSTLVKTRKPATFAMSACVVIFGLKLLLAYAMATVFAISPCV